MESSVDPHVPSSAPVGAGGHQFRWLLPLGILAVSAPVLCFYWLLFRRSVNLPEMDDYDAVLGFMNTFTALGTSGGRLRFFLSSEHVQYKLFFEHALIWMEWKISGHINFRVLQLVGNLFVLLTAGVLWLMFRLKGRQLSERLMLFCPVIFLLFAPRYQETLNWAMGSLQNLTVIFFSLLCLHLLQGTGSARFAGACAAMVLAIASSGNGFFLAAVAFLVLLQQKVWSRVAIWVAVTLCALLVYAYHYVLHLMPVAPGSAQNSVRVMLLFPVVFLSAAGGRVPWCLLLGAVLFVVAVLLVRREWRRSDPGTFYAVVFTVVTSLGVDLTRHTLGLQAAMASRYMIYSQLLLALLYMATLHEGMKRCAGLERRRLLLSGFALLTAAYWVRSEWTGMREIEHRTELVRAHYAAWVKSPAGESPVPDEIPGMGSPEMVAFRRRAAGTLLQSEKLKVFEPPPTRLLEAVRR